MLHRTWTLAALALLLAGCASSPATKSEAGPAAQPATASAEAAPKNQLKTPAGATLLVPEGLSAKQDGAQVTLQLPEADIKLTVVEVKSDDIGAAISQAWKSADPEFAGKVSQTLDPPARDGWDALRVENYVRAANGEVAQAVARRKGAMTWVMVLRGMPGSLDKRAAQMRSFIGSLEAPGVEALDFSAKQPRDIADHLVDLDLFIQEALAKTKTPGMSIAVVQGGKVAFTKGYGVRELGDDAPITPDTLMMIGSVSKSMTTLMMGSLVDEKKLSWDQPVQALMPDFALGDAELAKSLTLKQTVCACAGLPRKDLPLIIGPGGKSPEAVLTELATMKPSTGLGETFQYQNHMVAGGGYVAAKAAMPDKSIGEAYDALMQARVFGPMGMTRTTLDIDKAASDDDFAWPHAKNLKGEFEQVPMVLEEFATFIRPSGGIWSTAREMANYLLTELSGGVAPGGQRVVSEANLLARRAPQVAISADVHYGLGWVVAKNEGLQHVTHGGGTMGFNTLFSFWPEKQLGVVMIANGQGGALAEGLIRKRMLELWFDADLGAKARLKFALELEAKERAELAERLRPLTADEIEDIRGGHFHPELGVLTFDDVEEAFVLDVGPYRTELLRHTRKDGKETVMFASPPLAGVELEPPGDGEKGSFALRKAQELYLLQRQTGYAE